LGSDVAFFLNGPLALCTGKGENIQKIDKIFTFHALLILPNISVSTKTVYENYRHDYALYNRYKLKINDYIQKNRIDLVAKLCTNMLESSCFSLNKELAEVKEEIEKLNIDHCCLSGSGSTFFCLFDSGDESEVIEYINLIKENISCDCILTGNNKW
jgi:4-diphosphocytidyl-2-C-methyl-D-erythritol kinase